MSHLEKAKLYIVEGPLDQTINEQRLRKIANGANPEIEVQFNPATLKVSLANSLKENEQDTNNTASQYIGNRSSSLSVEFIFDTSDTYRNTPKEGDGANSNPKDVRDYVKKIAVNFMTPASEENGNQVPKRCLFAWGTFLFTGIMESLEETLDFFSPNGTPLRAMVAIQLSESRFQFINNEAVVQKSETPSQADTNSSPTDASQDLVGGENSPNSRAIAANNGAESLREKSTNALSVPAKKTMDDLKNQAQPVVLNGGVKGGFGAGLGAGFSASAGASLNGGLNAGLNGGINAGVSGGFDSGVSGGFNANLSGGISGGLNGSLNSSVNHSLGGGLSTSTNITPPAFSLGASSSIGTSIPGAFSADFKKGGGLPAGSLLSGGTALREDDDFFSSNVSSKNGNASASASASSNGFAAQASASVGFD